MIEEQIERDLKSAMLARDTEKVSTLRGLKSVFLYSKVASGSRDKPLPEAELITLLQKEAKKRQESADIYASGGEQVRADKELSEMGIIETYLPPKLSNEDLAKLIDDFMSENPNSNMGQIIAEIKSKTAGSAAGSDIARIVKGKLGQ